MTKIEKVWNLKYVSGVDVLMETNVIFGKSSEKLFKSFGNNFNVNEHKNDVMSRYLDIKASKQRFSSNFNFSISSFPLNL